jgi:hypothetical protein
MSPKQINNGLALQLCVKKGYNRFKEGQDIHCCWIRREDTGLADTKSIN